MKLKIKDSEYLAKIIQDFKVPTDAQVRALDLLAATVENKISQEEIDLLKITLSSCIYMQCLIDTFCAAHDFNYKKIRLNCEKFDIAEIVNEILAEIKVLIKYYELEVKFDSEKQIIVNADRSKIKRVIENIISNAINHAFSKSTITITLKKIKNDISFEVKNKSPYIDKEILKDIFEKCKPYSKECSKAGIGLGLYLSAEIIHAHFGKMTAQSSANDTNVFGFVIPNN